MTRFLKQAAAAFAGFLALAFALNVWVDPYRIWNVRHGFSQQAPRPRAVQQLHLLKSRGLTRSRPVTVVLGNSRAEIGFDPRSRSWPLSLRPVYNASIPGTGIDTATSLLSDAVSAGRLRTAVIGLDFLDFLTDPENPTPPTHPTAPAEQRSAMQRATEDVKIGLSLDTLIDSTLTLISAHDPYAPDVTADGFNPLREYALNARLDGYGSLFLQKDIANARAYTKAPKGIFARSATTSATWQELDQLLTSLHDHDIDVRFVIYPYHAHILEMFHRSGLFPAFESWKKHLAEVLVAWEGDGGICRLWDFSGYNAYSTEFVPPPDDRKTVVRWYWESGHFKPELGDRMLERMFGEGDAGFGTCLTERNIEAVNSRVREARTRYLRKTPEASAAIDALFRGVQRGTSP